MAAYDRIIIGLMNRWKIPGGAVAVARDGRLVFARAYGFADVERRELVKPDSLFRVASVSKPITAVTILKLVEEGHLSLDARAFDVLGYGSSEGNPQDPRIQSVTVRDLLQHSGGWNSSKGYDPMFQSLEIAREMGVPPPANAETIVRFMFARRKLDFAPGTRHQYSNFGYNVLGRVIERATGQEYAEYVRSNVLRPMGITRMRIANSRETMPDEVKYYDYAGAPLATSVFDGSRVPWPYGGGHIEAMDAHGGWVASAIDLVRFTTALDGSRQQFLRPDTRQTMLQPPPFSASSPAYYALGWSVRPVGNDANWWHNGSLPGTTTLLVRTYNGFVWAVVFNSRPKDWQTFNGEVDNALWEAYGQVNAWPDHDLFGQYA